MSSSNRERGLKVRTHCSDSVDSPEAEVHPAPLPTSTENTIHINSVNLRFRLICALLSCYFWKTVISIARFDFSRIGKETILVYVEQCIQLAKTCLLINILKPRFVNTWLQFWSPLTAADADRPNNSICPDNVAEKR
ncbi:hypothetical protein T11_16649 [Trichinella zimbabwensis]|uniref:Uncharacterized protein n=1 Tax=Trichinella zimbabwensis TaxID=268475 RepID=A0A0V1HV90_9BILA|nr:hypothetical protein T11_16649 [Trichinella zimbabwensis]